MSRFSVLASAIALLLLTQSVRATPRSLDRWIELAPPARAGHVAVLDSQHRRLLIIGGRVDGKPRNDVWALSLAPHSKWKLLEPAGPAPSARFGMAAAYDRARDRVLLFGGCDTSGGALDELWELRLGGRTAWRRLSPLEASPAPRLRATLTLEPGTESAILYGGAQNAGYGADVYADAWRLSLDPLAWTPMTPSGTPPRARSGHTAVYCPDLHGVLIFGGVSYADCYACLRYQENAELWLLALDPHPQWRPLQATTAGPRGVQGHVAIWDDAAHRMWTWGGGSFWISSIPGVWSLDVSDMSWSPYAVAAPVPRKRFYSAASFDPASRSLYVYGGERTLFDGGAMADTWILSLRSFPAWTRVPRDAEDAPFGPAVYDSLRDRVLVDAGTDIRAYEVETGQWSRLATAGEPPPPHRGGTLAFDTRRDRLLIYGGTKTLPTGSLPMDTVWALTIGNPATWSTVTTVGARPPTFTDAALYDPPRDRLLLWAPWPTYRAGHSGLWALSLDPGDTPSWSEMGTLSDSIEGSPAGLKGCTIAYDSARDRLTVFGGGVPNFDSYATTNGCWALPLTGEPRWQVLSTPEWKWGWTPGKPTPRRFAGGAYDPIADRLIIVGGYPQNIITAVPDDAWTLALRSNEWTALGSPNESHPTWLSATPVFDSRRGRILVFQNDEVWALEGGRLRPPGPIRRFAPRDALAGDRAPALELLGTRPNPLRGDGTIVFTLPDASPAALELIDIAGRRVWVRDVGALGAGTHAVPVAPGRRLAPGVYVTRLTSAGVARTGKLVLLSR